MASILKEIILPAPPEVVWDAIRDVGAVHRLLAPGFVSDVRLDGGARIVTFGNGAVVRELIVSIDDTARRLAYTASGGRASHHNSSMQVLEGTGGSTRLLWYTDVLPDEVEGVIRGMVDQGARAIQTTFSGRS